MSPDDITTLALTLGLAEHRSHRVIVHEAGIEIGHVDIVRVIGDKVRLSFTFPRRIGIDREQVFNVKYPKEVTP